jgi:hypothetical protein
MRSHTGGEQEGHDLAGLAVRDGVVKRRLEKMNKKEDRESNLTHGVRLVGRRPELEAAGDYVGPGWPGLGPRAARLVQHRHLHKEGRKTGGRNSNLTASEFPAQMERCLVPQQLGEGGEVVCLDSGVHGEPLGQHELGVESRHPGHGPGALK